MKKNLLILVYAITGLLSTTNVIAQVTANQPSDIHLCSENDFAVFDLTITEPEIVGGQNPVEFIITFYQSQADADNAINPIINPNAYANTINPQAIYARLERISNGEFDTTSFDIIVINIPIVFLPTPLEMCDDDYDGITSFDLTAKDNEVSGGDPDVNVTYHITQIDADLGINPLASPFANNIPFNQTVYVRAESIVSGCFSSTTLELIVQPIPDTISVSDYILLDDNGDGQEVFDLTIKIPEILNGQNDVEVVFFETQQDANTNTNAIAIPTSYINTTNPQVIYCRLEALITGCYAISSFNLIVADVLIEEEPEDLFINEGDNDGLAIFDLTVNEYQMLGSQDPLVALFTYHVALEDSENGLNAIETPNTFQNIVNPQTIFVRLTNSATGNFVLTSFEIETDGFLGVNINPLTTLNLYPNPTKEFVFLQSDYFSEAIEVIIFDMQGQVIISKNKIPNNNLVKVEVSNLLSGIYFVKTISGENLVIKRILKM